MTAVEVFSCRVNKFLDLDRILKIGPLATEILFKLPYFRNLDDHMKEVVQGAGIALMLKVCGASFSFGFSVLLARSFGADGAGIYFLALTVITICTTFGRFGLENTLLRFIAAHATNKEWGAVCGVYNKSMKLALVISLSVSGLIYFFAPLMAAYIFHKPSLVVPLRWMTLAITPLAIMNLHGEALKGLKRIRDSQLMQGTGLPVLACTGLFFLGSRFGVLGAVWVYVSSAVILALYGVFLWRRYTPQLRSVVGQFDAKRLFESCLPLFWVQVMLMIINWTAMFCMGVWASKAEIGIFSVALRTALLTSFILMSVNSIAAPKFSSLFSQRDISGLASVARQSAAMMTVFAAPLLLLFLIAPSWVMGLFGNEFKCGGGLLEILAIGQFINVATGSVGYLLTMSGNERLMRNNTIAVGILTVALNLILVPAFGAVGAAIATAVSMATLNLGAFYLVWKKLGIWTIPIFTR
jgi:O-antigen/teichoic acid export membrane protein